MCILKKCELYLCISFLLTLYASSFNEDINAIVNIVCIKEQMICI